MPRKKTPIQDLVPIETIEKRILLIRGHKVMLDLHLAELYEVSTKVLNQAVKRNVDRFPEDFMFRLNASETRALNRSQIVTGSQKHRDPRSLPYAFTEQGVAMLSSVLHSKRAVLVNIAIMRAFVRLRQILNTHRDLAAKLLAMEREYDKQFKVVFDLLRQLMSPAEPPASPRNQIGFVTGRN